MAINRYDTPAESNYFNTFVPLPLDQITALGMKRQEDLERKQDVASKYIDQASLVDYIANSKDEEWVKKNYMPMLQKYSEEAMSVDLTNPVEWAKYSTRLRGVGTSEQIRRIEESKKRWNQAQQTKQQLIATGKYNKLLDEDPAEGWDSTQGIYNYMPEAYVDKADLFEQYYKHMKPRSKGVMNIGGVNVLREGIDANDVRSISNQAAQELAATPLGQQQIRLFQKMYPDIAKEMNPVDILRTQMEDYGQQYIMSNDQVLPENLQGNGNQNRINQFGFRGYEIPGQELRPEDLDPAGAMKEFTNTLASGMTTTAADPTTTVIAGIGPGGFYNETGSTINQKVRDKAFNRAADRIIALNPNMKYGLDSRGNIDKNKILSAEEIYNNYNQARNDWNRSQTVRYTTENQQVKDQMNSMIAESIANRNIYIPSLNESMPAEEFFKKIGYKNSSDATDIMKSPTKTAIKVTGPSLNGDNPGYYSMSVQPLTNNRYADAVKTGDVLISGGDLEKDAFRGLYMLKNFMKSGINEPVPVLYTPRGTVIEATPSITYSYKDGRPSMDTKISTREVDQNGNIVNNNMGTMTFDELFQTAVNAIYQPGAGINPDDVSTKLMFNPSYNE